MVKYKGNDWTDMGGHLTTSPAEHIKASKDYIERTYGDPEPQPGDGPEKKCCNHCNHTAPLNDRHNVACRICANELTDEWERNAWKVGDIPYYDGNTDGKSWHRDNTEGAVISGASFSTGTGTTVDKNGIVRPLVPHDVVNHPSHYTGPVPGIECIDVTMHFNLLRGTAIKYLWRADYKGNKVQDLKKSIWYIQKEIDSLENPTKA